MKNSNGYSLIELLIAILVIGVLAAIAFPRYVSSMNRAMEARVLANMHAAQIACEEFASITDGIYPIDFAEPVYVSNPNVIGDSISIAGGITGGVCPNPSGILPSDVRNPVSRIGWAFCSYSCAVATPPCHPGGLTAPACGAGSDQGSFTYNSADIAGGPACTGATGGNAAKYAIYGYGVTNPMPKIISSSR